MIRQAQFTTPLLPEAVGVLPFKFLLDFGYCTKNFYELTCPKSKSIDTCLERVENRVSVKKFIITEGTKPWCNF